jgi:hypothetical protein
MNNIYPNSPAMMSDGRAFSNWQPTAALNEQIRAREHIQTNWAYRQYLQKNAISIMEFDQTTACQQTGCPNTFPSSPMPSEPCDLMGALQLKQGSILSEWF